MLLVESFLRPTSFFKPESPLFVFLCFFVAVPSTEGWVVTAAESIEDTEATSVRSGEEDTGGSIVDGSSVTTPAFPPPPIKRTVVGAPASESGNLVSTRSTGWASGSSGGANS